LRAQARLDHEKLPTDAVVISVRALEGLSVLFDVHVEILTEDGALDMAELMWSSACLAIIPDSTSAPRMFHGVIEEAGYLGFDGVWHRYRLRLRPSLHGLAYRVRTRIFQELNTVDIVKKVFTDAGIASDAVRWEVSATYPVREYCCQWKESELAYVLRLFEDEGIFYWFEHSETEHILHIGDAPSVHQPIDGDAVVPMRGHASQQTEALWDPLLGTSIVHDAYRSRDWYWETPGDVLQAQNGGEGLRLRYEYPGGYEDDAEAGRRALVRIETARRDRVVLRAKSDCVRLSPGKKFDACDVKPDLFTNEYLVTRVEHRFDRQVGTAGTTDAGDYDMDFSAIPAATPFRPPRVTPKPIASGLESAVVTGANGEEIDVDEFGRIKVHFYWDRENPVDDTASCRIRFQQMNTSGAMILPRLGWEVHVAFVDGDPDRPVAMHKAYNQETMPPYALPANKTQASLQSSTSPGGGSTNEIRMQDGNGGMEWSLNASRDLKVVVANDEKETIDVDVSESVGELYTASVGAEEHGKIGGNQAISVTKTSTTETVGSKKINITGNDDWGVKKNFAFGTGKDRKDDIGGLMNVLANTVSETFNVDHVRDVGAVQAIVSATAIAETVGGSKSETVTAAKAIVTPKDYAENMGTTKTLNSGAVTFKLGGDMMVSAKGAIALTSAGVIKIKCKENAMINGRQIRVTSGKADLKGGGGKFLLTGTITIDAEKFGGDGGPNLKIKGKINYAK
jgi:type VI secretion system secreted protein VgrG